MSRPTSKPDATTTHNIHGDEMTAATQSPSSTNTHTEARRVARKELRSTIVHREDLGK
jgi:hypothetical protein